MKPSVGINTLPNPGACDKSRCVHISESVPLGDFIKVLDSNGVQSTVSAEARARRIYFYYQSCACMYKMVFFLLNGSIHYCGYVEMEHTAVFWWLSIEYLNNLIK